MSPDDAGAASATPKTPEGQSSQRPDQTPPQKPRTAPQGSNNQPPQRLNRRASDADNGNAAGPGQDERRRVSQGPPPGLPERRTSLESNPQAQRFERRRADKGPPGDMPDRRQGRGRRSEDPKAQDAGPQGAAQNAEDGEVIRGERQGAVLAAKTEIKSRIRNLKFVDLYVPLHKNGVARYNVKNPRLGEPGNVPVSELHAGDLGKLREQLITIEKDDFSVVHDKVRYRGSRAELANGEKWVCLRRISDKVPTLEQLNIENNLTKAMRDVGHRHGLIIVCGGTGQGKSTTANALLADYLERLGNVAMTIEDPVEFNLAGERGNGGYCFQVEVDGEEDWAPALKRALRWHPRYLLVGEIRSGAAAAQVLRAATSGHLVITTFHAGSVEKGLQSIIQVAETEIGPRAQELVAEGLAAAFHQTLTRSGPEISYLFTDPSGVDPARQYIRAGKLHMLNSYMEQQAIRMGGGGLDQS
ncbi:MAG: ATPase, T2SS/T4P/T4SS family [Pseudomonadota bacterium]